jgi:hypothetical protein
MIRDRGRYSHHALAALSRRVNVIALSVASLTVNRPRYYMNTYTCGALSSSYSNSPPPMDGI